MSIHEDKYHRTESSATWINEKGQFLWRTETKHYDWDLYMHDFILVKTETKTETPEQLGYLKTMDFIIVFPDDSEPTKQFGKGSKKEPKLLMQVGTVTVRPENANTWLMKQWQNPIDRQGATGKWSIYVKTLSGMGKCYRFGYIANEDIACSVGEERETTITELKQLEAKGNLIFYHGRAMWSESEGFTYADIAMR